MYLTIKHIIGLLMIVLYFIITISGLFCVIFHSIHFLSSFKLFNILLLLFYIFLNVNYTDESGKKCDEGVIGSNL